jgi:hypothetical protein
LNFFGLYYISIVFYLWAGSSVGIATDYGLDGAGIESRWGRDFPPVQTDPGAHPASCTMGTGSFPRVKSDRGVLLTAHPLPAPKTWKSRAILLPPVGHNRACNGVTLPFYCILFNQSEDVSSRRLIRKARVRVVGVTARVENCIPPEKKSRKISTLSDPTSDLVRQDDFPVLLRCRKTSDTVFVAFVFPLSEPFRRFSSCSTDFSQQIAQVVLFLLLHVFSYFKTVG